MRNSDAVRPAAGCCVHSYVDVKLKLLEEEQAVGIRAEVRTVGPTGEHHRNIIVIIRHVFICCDDQIIPTRAGACADASDASDHSH